MCLDMSPIVQPPKVLPGPRWRRFQVTVTMGASQSKGNSDNKVFYYETPIKVSFRFARATQLTCSLKFSPDVVNHLSDQLASHETSAERQTTLDAHIRSRIQSDLRRLRDEEESVRQQIEAALEKENLEKEKSMTKSSTSLMGDLEEIRSKVDRFESRQEFEGVKQKGEAVVSCYR